MDRTDISVYLAAYDAVYIEVPKVACTSLKVALASLLEIDLEPSQGNPHAVNFSAPPEAPDNSDRLYPGLFAFAFVRNPWDRLVSCYRDKILGEVDGFTEFTARPGETKGVARCLARFEVFREGMSFKDFVTAVCSIADEEADAHFRSQSAFVTTREGEIGVDFLGRYETLASDFGIVIEALDLPPSVALLRLQAARRTARYVDYYSAETRAMVAERFADDIQNFVYKFGN